MTEIIVNSYPGTISLFLLETRSLFSHIDDNKQDPCNVTDDSGLMSIAAPYGCNHHNVAPEAIVDKKQYDLSLKDVYNLDVEKHLDKKSIDIISDHVTTPVIAAIFSVVAMPSRMQSETNPFLHDVVKDEPIEGYTTTSPKIAATSNLSPKASTPSKSSRRSVRSQSKLTSDSATLESQGKLN